MGLLRSCSLLVLILLCGSAAMAQPAPQMLSHKVPEQTWNAEIKSFGDAQPFSLNDYKGKVILLVVWAYWCRPCLNTMDDLVKIEREFAGRNLAIVGISLYYSFPDDKEGAIDYVQQSHFKFKMGWITQEIGNLLMADSAQVPNLMLINSDGVLVERILGFNPAKTPTLLRDELQKLLKSSANPEKQSAESKTFQLRETEP